MRTRYDYDDDGGGEGGGGEFRLESSSTPLLSASFFPLGCLAAYF